MEASKETQNFGFNRLSLAEQVETALRREITEGRVAPGARVNVGKYQELWEVSSTPFRDALRTLEMQGFVRIESRKGAFVAQMNIETLVEVFDVRIALECMAVELATPRIPEASVQPLVESYRAKVAGRPSKIDVEQEDRAVHDLAEEFVRNMRFKKLLVGQKDLFAWAQNTIIAELPHSFALALPEHLEIAEAYLARDVGAAVQAMRRHLENSRDRLIALRNEAQLVESAP